MFSFSLLFNASHPQCDSGICSGPRLWNMELGSRKAQSPTDPFLELAGLFSSWLGSSSHKASLRPLWPPSLCGSRCGRSIAGACPHTLLTVEGDGGAWRRRA